jgi:outer membrane protein assembly factor BamA
MHYSHLSTRLRPTLLLLAAQVVFPCIGLQAQDITQDKPDVCIAPEPPSESEDFRFVPSEKYDVFANSLLPGTVIGSITFRRFNVFNLNDPKESNWLYSLANQLHIVTRESVIREQLLFAEGDYYIRARLEESERLLRDLNFVYDATVRAWRLCGEVVDVEVITRDTWTLSPAIDFSRSGGTNSSSLGITDSNILGSGKEIGYIRENDPDRSGNTFLYRDPALFGSRWHMALTLSDNDDGHYRFLGFHRPFFSIYEPWSAGARVSQAKFEEATWYRGEEVTEFNQEVELFNASGGIAVNVEEDKRVGRWLFGVHYETNEFSFSDSRIPPAELPDDRDLAYPFIGYESIKDDYMEVRNMSYLGRTEDFYTGEHYQWSIGWSDDSFGATRDQVALQGNYGNTMVANDRELWDADTSLTAYWNVDSEDFENLLWSTQTRYHHRQADKWTLFGHLRLDYADGLTDDNQLVLGGDTGLRGYDRNYQVGNKSFVVNLEERYYSDWHPFRLFRVGGAVFFDVGRAWFSSRDNGSNGGVLADVGLGLRLNSSRARKTRVIHIDLAFPLTTGDDVDSVQLLFKAREKF